jgi:cell division septal protein FtsQ
LGSAVYFIFYSPYFSIKSINISGLERINHEEIKGMVETQMAERRFFIFKQNNIFVFDENAASKNINEKYALKVFKIDKRLPEALIISVEERSPALIWKTSEKYYIVDWDGTIIREITPEEVSGYQENQPGAKMALVFDDSNASVGFKDKILSSETVLAISNLQINIPAAGLMISNFKVTDKNDSAIKCLTGEGWEIYFSVIGDLNAQLEKLRTFLKEKKSEDRKSLQYVDLRFTDRIYYK